MIAYQKEKFENAICYFATEHAKRTERPTCQTYIYKYLSLFDFTVLTQTGKPSLNINYDAHRNGPVPHIYNQRYKYSTELYDFVCSLEDRNIIYVIPKKAPNLDYFSEFEIGIMNGLLDEFAIEGTTTNPIIKATHKRIRAWQEAWRRRGLLQKAKMRYDDTFPNFRNKSEEHLTPQEESFLVYKGLEKAPS